ncbi:MAG: hypothetical protein WCO31_08250, partial [Actinomycetes bacterium]
RMDLRPSGGNHPALDLGEASSERAPRALRPLLERGPRIHLKLRADTGCLSEVEIIHELALDRSMLAG